MERDFKGVWIPKEIWLCEELSALDKVVLAEIDSLDNEQHCIASNEYLSQFCGVSVPTITRSVKKLVDMGYIEVVSFDGRKRVLRSLIKMIKQTNQIDYAPSSKCSANNIDSNIENNNGISKDIREDEDVAVNRDKMSQQEEFASHMYSREDMQAEFFGSASKVSKPKGGSLYSKCSAEINAYTQNAELSDALHRYLTLRLRMTDKPIRGVNQWKGMLKKLDEFGADVLKVVEQSIEHGWASFYALSKTGNNNFMEHDISVGYGIIHPGAESTPKNKRGGKEF